MKRVSLALMFFLIFASFIKSINAQWAKTYGGNDSDQAYSIQQTSDGGYIVAGRTNSYNGLWILKLSTSGIIEWQRYYEGTYFNDYSIQQTSDGGYIVAGSRFLVLKLSSEGDIEWQRSYSYGEEPYPWEFVEEVAYSIQQTSDGGYIVAGYIQYWYKEDMGRDFLVLKLSSEGDIEWQRSYGTRFYHEARSIQQTSDGGYTVAGYTRIYRFPHPYLEDQLKDFWILKLSSSGDIEWARTYGGAGYDEARSIQQTSDGGFIVAGTTNSFGAGGRDFWVLKLSSSGDTEWGRTYGGADLEEAHSIQQTSDGGYIVAGTTKSFGAGGSDFWVLKLSSSGDTEWGRTYGGPNSDEARSIQQTSDGVYIVAGTTNSFGAGGLDFLVLKLSQNGDIDTSCGDFIQESNAQYSWAIITPEETSISYNNRNLISQDTNITPWDTDATVNVICRFPPPLSFAYLSPPNNATDKSVDIDLDWEDSSGATSYDVYFGITSPPPKVTTVTSSLYDAETLNYSTTYYWKVVAKNGGGEVSGSEWRFTTQHSPIVIQGSVKTSVDLGLEGVTITFSNAGGTATTGSDGNYSHTLSYGWSGTATPSMAGYIFSPTSRTYTNATSDLLNQDYTATPVVTISGTVSVGASGLSGVVMNGLPGNPTTDASGNYNAAVDYGWSGTVTPSKAGYTFSPASRTYTNVTSEQTTQDYTVTAIITPAILGSVKSGAGEGIAGVTIAFSNGAGTATTDSNGNYSHSVTYGWSGTVTPSKTNYTFDPSTRSYSNITSDQTNQDYTASFIQYTLTISAGTGGTTDPAPGTHTYDVGTDVAITATPDTGYRFADWSGDASGTDNPITITMDSNKSLTANFIRQYTLTIAAGTGGTTNPAPGTHAYDTGTQVTITATPNSGYEFSGWSGDASGTTNPITITMDADKTITSTFSSTSSGGGDGGDEKKGCFIATAAYGSPLHSYVRILRDFRDKYLMPSKLGRALVGIYYKYSPSVVDFIMKHKVLKAAVRFSLMPVIVFSYSMLHFGLVFTTFMFLFIFLLPIPPILFCLRRMRRVEAKNPKALACLD